MEALSVRLLPLPAPTCLLQHGQYPDSFLRRTATHIVSAYTFIVPLNELQYIFPFAVAILLSS